MLEALANFRGLRQLAVKNTLSMDGADFAATGASAAAAAAAAARGKQLVDALQVDLHALCAEARKKCPAIKLVCQ